MTRYVVWKPGKEAHAKVIEASTSFEARRIAALGKDYTDLCAMREAHLSFVGPRVRSLLEVAIGH